MAELGDPKGFADVAAFDNTTRGALIAMSYGRRRREDVEEEDDL